MLSLTGRTGGEYFHIECEACRKDVTLSNLRWVGGVPQMKAKCDECGQTGDFKLHPGMAMGITQPMGS